MKFAVIVLACVAIVAVQATAVNSGTKIADETFLEKEKFFLEILRNVGEPLMFQEYIKYGEKLIIDQTKYTTYDFRMAEFYDAYKIGELVPLGEVFSVINRPHVAQGLGLFNFFFYAKDWETYMSNVVWARINVNQGMFVYALTLSVFHRPDLQGIILPQIYEIFPQMFFTSKLVTEAQKFDWDLFNKQIMYEKQFKTIYEKKHFKNIHGKYWYTKDWKVWQWWKLMGLDDGWHLEKKCILRENVDVLMNDSKFTAIWNDLHMVWMPIDYTRDIDILNNEAKLSYFTEDVGWNAYWYYLNMDFAKVLRSDQLHLSKDRRGEFYVFLAQQFLARYYMERLSNGLGQISAIPFHGTIKAGYNPQLIGYNGVGFSSRKNYWEVQSYEDENVELLNKIIAINSRIDDTIASGKLLTRDGVTIDLTKPESMNVIGNILQGNVDIIDKFSFGYLMTLSKVYLSGHVVDDMSVMPSIFSNYETVMRDPIYYQMLKKLTNIFYDFRFNLPPYTQEELLLPGVIITDVKVDKLMTYFDLVDFDVTNLMTENMVFENGRFVLDKVLLGRQMRLNHKPFNIELLVRSDKAQKIIVRTSIAPDTDEFGQKINLIKHRENIMQIDEFVAELVAGENVIKRNSKECHWTIRDRTTYSELYKLVMMAYEGKYELPMDISEAHCGFPDRLVLPRGWISGMPLKMIFVIAPYNQEPSQTTMGAVNLCARAGGAVHLDDLPHGYPFDRKIVSITDFSVPNIFWKDVKIYHMDNFEKYQGRKYVNLGTFDYNFK